MWQSAVERPGAAVFQDTRIPLPVWFRAMWRVTTQKNGASALGLQRVLGLKEYRTAWMMLHKLRRAMVRPGRDLLTGRIEVDECYVGGEEAGLPGRLNLEKSLVVVAAQEDGPGIGRIRMRHIANASAESLLPFVQDSVAPGSVIHTDGWLGYLPLDSKGYEHEVTFLKGKKKTASELMPRVHRVISRLIPPSQRSQTASYTFWISSLFSSVSIFFYLHANQALSIPIEPFCSSPSHTKPQWLRQPKPKSE